MKVLVIQETDLEDGEQTVIGVADTIENSKKLINKYYGKHEIITYHTNNDYIGYSKVLEIKGIKGIVETYKVEVFAEWFDINKL